MTYSNLSTAPLNATSEKAEFKLASLADALQTLLAETKNLSENRADNTRKLASSSTLAASPSRPAALRDIWHKTETINHPHIRSVTDQLAQSYSKTDRSAPATQNLKHTEERTSLRKVPVDRPASVLQKTDDAASNSEDKELADHLLSILGRSELTDQPTPKSKQQKAPTEIVRHTPPAVSVLVNDESVVKTDQIEFLQLQIDKLNQELAKLRERYPSAPTVLAKVSQNNQEIETQEIETVEVAQEIASQPELSQPEPISVISSETRKDDLAATSLVAGERIISFVGGEDHQSVASNDTEEGNSEQGDQPPPRKLKSKNKTLPILGRLAAILLLLGVAEGARRFYTGTNEVQSPNQQTAQKTAAAPGLPDNTRQTASVDTSKVDALRIENPSDKQTTSPSDIRTSSSQNDSTTVQSFTSGTSGRSSFDTALKAKDPRALFEKGVQLSATGTEEALMEATLYYYEASEKGFAPATFRLGVAFEKGLGLKVDKAKAASLYERAAREGNIKAMHNLGMLFAFGFANGKQDYARASEWFRKAADRGFVDSQFNYGLLAANGLGMSQNAKEAFQYFSLAAAQGDANAIKRRDQLAQQLTEADKADLEQKISTFKPLEEKAEANEKTLPAAPWHKRDWSYTGSKTSNM